MKKYSIELKWGILFVVIALLWMYFEKLMGWHDENIAKHAIYTNLFAVIAIFVYVLALRDKRNNFYGGSMTWSQGFVAGLIVTLIVTILNPLSQYITHRVITPEYFTNVINYAVESGQMTREAAEKHFNMNSYILQSSLFGLVIGAVTSAIVALFLRKKGSDTAT